MGIHTTFKAANFSCGEQACLRWAAKQPQTQTLSSFRKIAVPLLGPLRSPTQDKPARHNSPPATDFVLTGCVDTYDYLSMGIHTTFKAANFSCGEQACPALGCEAAPNPDAEFFQENCSAFTGAASQPNAGQACSPQQPACHRLRVNRLCRYLWLSQHGYPHNF